VRTNSDLFPFARVFMLVILLATGTALAQNVTFQATVDKNPVGVNDQFTLNLSLSSSGAGGGKNMQLPDLSKFRIMSGPNQSSSMQFINGAVSSSVTYSYVLEPKDIGTFTIGSFAIEVGGKTYHTNPISLEVVKGSPKPKQQTATADDVSGQIGDNLFLRAVVSKAHVIQGEQVNLAFKLYSRVQLLDVREDKASNLIGFWGEEIERPKDAPPAVESVNGKQYRVFTIKQMALFPTQSGLLEISPMVLKANVQVQTRRSQDPFDSFFSNPFGRSTVVDVKSDAVKIKVDPLPSGAPADFKGAVGKFAMSTAVDKKTTRTNEAVTLKVTISGTGNIKLLESPAVDLPTDFEQYSPKVSDNISRPQGSISGSKTFEYLLIPRYPGLKVIKPVTFSYFDLGTHDYVRLRSPQIELNVEQGAASPAPLVAGGSQEDVRLLSQDIRFIKVGQTAFLRPGEHLYSSAGFILLLLLPLAALAGVFVYSRQRQAVLQDQVGYRNRKAMKVAQKGLKQAAYLLKESAGSPNAKQRLRFYAEISRALWKYLGDKLNIPQSEFSVEGAVAELSRRGVETDLQQSLRMVLESCDMARFAPTSLGQATMEKTYEEARRIIVELERTLRS
jgi:hypothetical protein